MNVLHCFMDLEEIRTVVIPEGRWVGGENYTFGILLKL